MQNVSVIALAVMLSGAGVWYAQMNRRETNRAVRGVIIGNVVIDGSSLAGDQAALLRSSLAVDGDLHLRSLSWAFLGSSSSYALGGHERRERLDQLEQCALGSLFLN